MYNLANLSRSKPQPRGDAALLDVRTEGGRISLYTGEASLRSSRLYARGVGALAILGGLAMLTMTVWGSALIGFGVLALLLVPASIKAVKLLEIDKDAGRLIVVQATGDGTDSVAIEEIWSIRGVYDTKGWDGFSVLYAELESGAETPVLMLLGTDERLAEQACRTLGQLLDRPASYTGPFGALKRCYTPARPV